MQGIYTPEDVVAILKESFSHVSEQWAQSHEDHTAATVATITKVLLPPHPVCIPLCSPATPGNVARTQRRRVARRAGC